VLPGRSRDADAGGVYDGTTCTGKGSTVCPSLLRFSAPSAFEVVMVVKVKDSSARVAKASSSRGVLRGRQLVGNLPGGRLDKIRSRSSSSVSSLSDARRRDLRLLPLCVSDFGVLSACGSDRVSIDVLLCNTDAHVLDVALTTCRGYA